MAGTDTPGFGIWGIGIVLIGTSGSLIVTLFLMATVHTMPISYGLIIAPNSEYSTLWSISVLATHADTVWRAIIQFI